MFQKMWFNMIVFFFKNVEEEGEEGRRIVLIQLFDAIQDCMKSLQLNGHVRGDKNDANFENFTKRMWRIVGK